MKFLGNLKIIPSSSIAESRVGVGFECADRDVFKPECCYDAMGATGAKWARVQTGWAKTEKKRGVYDFTWLDEMVDNLRARGITPWFNVGYGNPIYMPDAPNSTAVGCIPLLYGNEVTEAWKRFLHALAEHYRGRVTYFEIWNESDISHFWYPGTPNAAQYAALISLSGGIIRQHIPQAKIGACTSDSKLDYLRTLFLNLKPGELDFYCLHTYDRFPETSPRILRTPEIRALLAEYGHNTELWMGEGGHASWHPVGHGQCKDGGGNEHRQCVWQMRRMLLDFKAGLRLTSYFMIADVLERPYEMAKKVQTAPARQGILNGLIYTPKQVYFTLSRTATLLGGQLALLPDALHVAPVEDTQALTVSWLRDGAELHAYYLPHEIERETPLRPLGEVSLADTGITHPWLIDMMTGYVYDVSDQLDRRTLKDMPIGDYPLVLCEAGTVDLR